MRIRATCHACDRDFLFFELRNTGAGIADRCPNCDRLLGARGVLAVRAEQALAVLVGSLEELARSHPNFTVHTGSVLKPVDERPRDPHRPPSRRARRTTPSAVETAAGRGLTPGLSSRNPRAPQPPELSPDLDVRARRIVRSDVRRRPSRQPASIGREDGLRFVVRACLGHTPNPAMRPATRGRTDSRSTPTIASSSNFVFIVPSFLGL